MAKEHTREFAEHIGRSMHMSENMEELLGNGEA